MKNKYKKVGKPKLFFTALLVSFALFSGQSSIAQCTPSTTGPWDYIATFNTTGGFTNISHTSTAMATGGYGDFTAVYSVSQMPGESISFSETYSGNGGHGPSRSDGSRSTRSDQGQVGRRQLHHHLPRRFAGPRVPAYNRPGSNARPAPARYRWKRR